ncbi:MAG: glycerol-3-phosphate acyltransferase [Streptococcus sp.]
MNLREHGSGNTGTTNTFRILTKAGHCLCIDFLKEPWRFIPFFWVQGISPMVFGLLAVLYTFPIFTNLKEARQSQPVLCLIIFSLSSSS